MNFDFDIRPDVKPLTPRGKVIEVRPTVLAELMDFLEKQSALPSAGDLDVVAEEQAAKEATK